MNTICRSAATALLCLGLKVASEELIVQPGGKSIQSVLDGVKPGDVVILESGEYFEDLKTRVHGTEGERITIKGAGGNSGRESVVIRGTGDQSRVFQLMHDYYTLEDFTINGEEDDKGNARNILLYVAADGLPTERSGGYLSTLDGSVITGMAFKHALGECVHIRNFVTYADINNNDISDCGLLDFVIHDDSNEMNGEGIYLGTARNQWDDETNPSREADICLGNRIRNNNILTNGNEGVAVKEGCLETVIENNDVFMQHDESAGASAMYNSWMRVHETRQFGNGFYSRSNGISSHADNTTITGNLIENAAGAGVRVGTTDPDEDGIFYGLDNTVTGNMMVNCKSSGVKTMSIPQRAICGNDIELPPGQDKYTYNYSGGEHGDEFEPFEACDGTATPSPTPSTPVSSVMTNTPVQSVKPGTASPVQEPRLAQSALIPGAEYLGCWKDKAGERTLQPAYKARITLTNEGCIDHCRNEGYLYAGTMIGRMCRCGNDNVFLHGESTNCTMDCPQVSRMPCGGDWAVTSWKILRGS